MMDWMIIIHYHAFYVFMVSPLFNFNFSFREASVVQQVVSKSGTASIIVNARQVMFLFYHILMFTI